jgi:transcription termination factor Rho
VPRAALPGAEGRAPGPQGITREGLQGARVGEKKEGARREGKGRERKRERGEKGGKGSSPRGSNSSDHRLQNLGHHREREMGEREVAAWEKSNERKGTRGRAHGEQGAPGAPGARKTSWAGPGWVGLG